MLPAFTPTQWLLGVLAAFCVGLSKNGFPGVGLVTVIVLAHLFPPMESTGILLPLLIAGDLCAVVAFQKHADWHQIWKMLPPTFAGVGLGYLLMKIIPEGRFGPVIGWILLLMVVLQATKKWFPSWYAHVPHTRRFAWSMGLGSGIATMLANAAGPIMSLYFLAINLPKYVFIGTSAWFFLLVNVSKVPFSVHLGLIHGRSLLFNLVLLPAVIAGALLGRHLLPLIPQAVFEAIMLIFAGVASLRLIGLL